MRRAAACAKAAGVTRLADVTGLDCVGVPVFQAVRPWSRALSVHQGKGLTAEAARIGALMEAVESHRAESFDAPSVRCAFEDLAEGERAPTISDFASARARSPDPSEPLAWVEARRFDGRRLWVPHDVVSLDFSRRGDERLERSSNGMGARGDLDGAIFKALLELIERDADRCWQALPIERRSRDRVNLDSIAYGWFEDLRHRFATAGLRLSIYKQAAVVPLPVFLSELVERGAGDSSRGAVYGVACHPSAEQALLGSVLEAVQSRLTEISGVRDDILHSHSSGHGFGFGLPLPSGMRATDWWATEAQFGRVGGITVSGLVELLGRAGYADSAIVDLSGPEPDVAVVKAVVPGLGAFERGRRSAMARS